MVVIDFDEVVSFRIRADELKMVRKIVRRNRDLFFNVSHFVRASVIKSIRDYDRKGKKK